MSIKIIKGDSYRSKLTSESLLANLGLVDFSDANWVCRLEISKNGVTSVGKNLSLDSSSKVWEVLLTPAESDTLEEDTYTFAVELKNLALDFRREVIQDYITVNKSFILNT